MDKKLTQLFIAAGVTLSLTGCPFNFTEAELSDDEKVVALVCQSEKPRVVVDYISSSQPDFGKKSTTKYMDIDGDRINDKIHHGDLSSKIIEINGHTVIRYGTREGSAIHDSHHGHDEKEQGVAESDFTVIMDDILMKIKNGDMEKPAAVFLSLEWPATLEELHRYFGDDLSLTMTNISSKKEKIIERLNDQYGENGSGDEILDFYYKTHEQFVALKKENVAIIVAAGNNHSKKINVLSLLGGISVGALTPDRNHIAPYSNQSSLTTIYRVGEFKTRRVPDGVDINGDGNADFLTPLLSNDTNLIKTFRGTSTWGATAKGTSYAAPNLCNPEADQGNLAWLYKLLP